MSLPRSLALPSPARPRRLSPALGRIALAAGLATAALAATGCAAAPQAMRAELPPLELAAPAPEVLDRNLFKGDESWRIGEDALQKVLRAPVFLEAGARIGVLPVASGYAPDGDTPLDGVPAALRHALEAAGLADAVTEITTDWPAEGGIAGLREIAARYRVEYLLLYRQRFVHRSWANGWAWLYPTGIGLFGAPGRTLEVDGVLEATLFEVKTGTLLFTSHARVHDRSRRNLWQNARKRRAVERALLEEAAEALSAEVVAQARRLAALRPAPAAALSDAGGS